MNKATLDDLVSRPFTLEQALAAGLSRSRLAALLRERSVRRVLHSVYVSSTLADNLSTRVEALKLIILPFVVLCDRTAAWLHGVDVLAYAELDVPPPLDTCVPQGNTRVRKAHCKGRRRHLARGDVMELSGVLVTTPLRTALDLGCLLSRRTALACLDWFLRLGYFNQQALKTELHRFARQRGVIQLRELVVIADGRAESPGESWTRLAIIDAGLPVPELQWVIHWRGRELFRLDLAYPKHRVCIEYDGVEFHDSLEAQAHDAKRRSWLREHGWTVIVVRKEDFTNEAIAGWTEELRQAL